MDGYTRWGYREKEGGGGGGGLTGVGEKQLPATIFCATVSGLDPAKGDRSMAIWYRMQPSDQMSALVVYLVGWGFICAGVSIGAQQCVRYDEVAEGWWCVCGSITLDA